MPFPTVTVIGSDWSDTSNTVMTLTFDAAVPAGDDVLLTFGRHIGTVGLVGVTDTQSNTWNLVYYTQRGGTYYRGFWRSRITNPISIGDTVTITLDVNTTNKKAIALRVQGLADPPPVYDEILSYTDPQGDAVQEVTYTTLPKPGSLIVLVDAGAKLVAGTITPSGVDGHTKIERDDVGTLLVGWKIKPDASGHATHTIGTTIADGGATSRASGSTSFQSEPLPTPPAPEFDPTGVLG